MGRLGAPIGPSVHRRVRLGRSARDPFSRPDGQGAFPVRGMDCRPVNVSADGAGITGKANRKARIGRHPGGGRAATRSARHPQPMVRTTVAFPPAFEAGGGHAARFPKVAAAIRRADRPHRAVSPSRGRPRALPRGAWRVQRPSVETTSSAAAAPENCCWPVIRLPSRMAKGLNMPFTTKLVSLIFLASSSIQNGWIFRPTQASA